MTSITVQVTGVPVAVDGIRRQVSALKKRIEAEVKGLAVELQQYAVTKKLQGQVLNVKTGKLQRSVRAEIEGQGTDQARGYIAVNLGNVPYARIHELGGKIHHPSRARKLRFRANSKGEFMTTALFGGKGRIFASNRHRRVIEQEVVTKDYTVTMPQRSYMGSSLAEMTPKIKERLQAVVGAR